MADEKVSVIVPVFNEAKNILPLISALETTFKDHPWEVIFVDDDSPDNSIQKIREISETSPHVRSIHRIGRRGLSSAVIEGALSSSSPFIVIMDGDLQHDETCIISMLQSLQTENYDISVASRYVMGGADTGLANTWRRLISRIGRSIIRLLLQTSLSDPMSGFFMMRRKDFISRHEKLSGVGFKILLDIILADRHPLRISEVPMVFRQRQHGESKLSWKIILSFVHMLFFHSIHKKKV